MTRYSFVWRDKREGGFIERELLIFLCLSPCTQFTEDIKRITLQANNKNNRGNRDEWQIRCRILFSQHQLVKIHLKRLFSQYGVSGGNTRVRHWTAEIQLEWYKDNFYSIGPNTSRWIHLVKMKNASACFFSCLPFQ